MGAATSAVTTVLGLTLLQTLTVGESPSRVGQMLQDLDHLLERALDPTVPALPDRSVHSPAPAKTGNTMPAKTGNTIPKNSTPATSTTTPTTTPRLPVPAQQRAV